MNVADRSSTERNPCQQPARIGSSGASLDGTSGDARSCRRFTRPGPSAQSAGDLSAVSPGTKEGSIRDRGRRDATVQMHGTEVARSRFVSSDA